MAKCEEKTTRKRVRDESRWHRVKSKKAREIGCEYMLSNCKTVPAKTVPEGDLCNEKCKWCCNVTIPVEVRHKIFDSFYSLDTNSQNCYLFKNIEPCKPQMQRVFAKATEKCHFTTE